MCHNLERNGRVHKLVWGERSRAAAEALRGWLPKIINAIKPWLSSEDIDKGARWSTDVASRLEAAKAGIICLTPSNLHSDWILFEAGALSKTLKNTFVCPFLIGLDPSDVLRRKGLELSFQPKQSHTVLIGSYSRKFLLLYEAKTDPQMPIPLVPHYLRLD